MAFNHIRTKVLNHALPNRSTPACIGIPATLPRWEPIVAGRLRIPLGHILEHLSGKFLGCLPDPGSNKPQRWQLFGAVAFGPEAVLKTLTVGELKDFWDRGAPKDVMFGSNLMQDHETLEDLPLQADLTVAKDAEAQVRASAAAAVLQNANCDTILQDRRANPRFCFEYTCCLIALEAVYGRDVLVWNGRLHFGGVPTLPNMPLDAQKNLRNYQQGRIRQFQTNYWPVGRLFPAEPLLEALRRLDHSSLERAVNLNVEFKKEFQPLLAMDNLSSTLLGSWLDVSVKSFLLKYSRAS